MTFPGFVAPLVDAIVQVCDPEEVVLFGSYAKGLERRDSDVDLLAVCARRPSWSQRQEIVGLTSRLAVQVDVHFLTPAEVDAANADPAGFYGSALRSGWVVHRRGHGSNLSLARRGRRC
jgi:predicted nucleotidyltransferase